MVADCMGLGWGLVLRVEDTVKRKGGQMRESKKVTGERLVLHLSL